MESSKVWSTVSKAELRSSIAKATTQSFIDGRDNVIVNSQYGGFGGMTVEKLIV